MNLKIGDIVLIINNLSGESLYNSYVGKICKIKDIWDGHFMLDVPTVISIESESVWESEEIIKISY